jgi:hypothetical protein
MGTIWVKEFTGGLDTRRLPETTPGGVLIVARDGHITRGGEFEKRAAFVKYATLPAGTKNLAAKPTGLVVFGEGPAPSALPVGVTYQRLVHATTPATPLRRVLSYDLYAGKIYAVAEFGDGALYHYLDGALVTSWQTLGYARGTFARTAGKKMYSVAGPNAHFSKVGDPTDFDPASVGAGFIDMSAETSGAETLRAVAKYQNYLVFFAEETTQTWFMDPDPTLNRLVQVLNNTGTVAPRSVTQFGDSDVFYLAASGLRSLKARDASNAAATTDIGVSIDSLIVSDLEATTLSERDAVTGLIEPNSGRFWLSIKGRIFVFSFFSGAKVSAWSTYEPGFTVEDMLPFHRKVYLRSGDDIYVYGGTGASLTYDATQAEAWLPYLDANKPTEAKRWMGVDAACTGDWEVRAGMDPTDLGASDKLATISETTFNLQKIDTVGNSTHLSLRFKSTSDGPAVLSSAVLHYEGDDGDKD